jgi:hypothetical protein
MAAPAQYVVQTVLKLTKLAKERKLQGYLKVLPAQQRQDIEEEVLKENWPDAIPFRLRETNKELTSVWDLAETENQSRLAHLMHTWIIQDKVPQLEIEDRLRFFNLEHGEGGEDGQDSNVTGPFWK